MVAPESIPAMIQALPQGFDFYHLGRVELEADESAAEASAETLPSAADHFGIAYRFAGEVRGVLLLLIGEGLDVSTYSEMGNIIASRTASSLSLHSAERALDVTISPPQILRRAQLKALLASTGDAPQVRTYTHRHGDHAITLRAVLLSALAPEVSLDV